MSEITCIFGAQKGTKIEYKDSLTWYEFMGVSKSIKANAGDEMKANNELIKLAVTKITTPEGQEISDSLPILKAIESLDVRDVMHLIKALTALIQDNSDPKESAQG